MIICGDANLVLAGGQGSKSQAHHLLNDSRKPYRYGDQVIKDSMIVDGMRDAFHDLHMKSTAENLAHSFKISSQEQDEFPLNSHIKAMAAWRESRFEGQVASVILVNMGNDVVVSHDESLRNEVTLKQLADMKPVFDRGGSITASNASGLNEGAAVMTVGNERALYQQNIEPIAHIKAYGSAALGPMDMGIGPVIALHKALIKAGWRIEDINVFELNEAFAAQTIAVNRELGCDFSKVNLPGGGV